VTGPFMNAGGGEPGVGGDPGARRSAPAALRNRDPILSELTRLLAGAGRVLEIASGTGEHAVHFAAGLPHLTWQPTDRDADLRASVAAHRAAAGLGNLAAPLALDAAGAPWPVEGEGAEPFDAVFCANMIHIAPWAAAEGLLRGAGVVLRPGGRLILYGPFRRGGAHTAPSNEAFDARLRAEHPGWGVRDLEAVADEASPHGLGLEQVVDMPANNLLVVFARR